jgi:hypothetical protein
MTTVYQLTIIYLYNNGKGDSTGSEYGSAIGLSDHGIELLDQLKKSHFYGRLCIMDFVLKYQESANICGK